jgi:hypothetical protein
VLWAGAVKAPNGTPSTDAEVVAYARPSENELQPGGRLVEVARTTSDDTGRFTLRAPGGGAMAASADPGGWTTVMVIATGSAGTSVAVDSIAWQPLGGVQGHSAAAGRWVTDPADLTSDSAAVLQEGSVPTTERPDALVLSTAGRAARTVLPFGGPSRAPGSYCMLLDKRDLGKQPVTIGHMHMERDWTGHFITPTRGRPVSRWASRWTAAPSPDKDPGR